MKLRWTTWLFIWLAIGVCGGGFTALLAFQGATTAARVVAVIANLAFAGWLIFGLWHWRDILWVGRLAWVVIATILVGFFLQVALDMGWTGAAMGVGGAYGMTVGFIVGLMLIRLVLSPAFRVTAVARTLVDEAIRMKVALVFIVAMLLLVPMLPLMMDAEQMLKYRIQTFLAWSTISTGVLLALMTIFLAVGTITSEINRRQIFVTMTKPLARWQYLAGKWLGIALLNALLVAVAGGGIYTFTTLLARQAARSGDDRRAVQSEVLTARESTAPHPTSSELLQRQFEQRLHYLQRQAPAEYGEAGTPASELPANVQREVRQYILRQWYTLDPRENVTYVFHELERARDLGGTVQLRLKPELGDGGSGFAYLDIRVNDRQFLPRGESAYWELASETYHVLAVPAQWIDDDGVLRVTLRNPPMVDAAGNEHEQSSIRFNTDDGLQLLYRINSFEANLVRSLALVWLHLCFLAILGLTAGAVLSFPAASLLSLVVYVVGVLSGYLRESLDQYAAFPSNRESLFQQIVAVPQTLWEQLSRGELAEALRMIIRLVGEGTMLLIPTLSTYDPTPFISDGLAITGRMMLDGAGMMGLWSLVVAAIGWALFHYRELARVTV
ncbi:MAG: ABC transporter permease [Phycisphaeraceae bacterium]